MEENSKPLVSIIVPVYNVEKYVARCLLSIAAQTYHNIEVIVVDDGATDSTGEICDSIAAEDSRFKVFHNDNMGVSAARNYAIKQLSGEWVICVDSDDIVAPNYIELLLRGTLDNACDISCCGYIDFDDNNERETAEMFIRESEDNVKYDVIFPKDFVIDVFYQRKPLISPCCKLIKREIMDSIIFPEGLMWEDRAIFFDICKNAEKVAICGSVLYGYRVRRDSLTHKRSSGRELNSIDIASIIEKSVQNAEADIVLAARCHIFNMFYDCFYRTAFYSKDEIRKQIWGKMKEYRVYVLRGSKARLFEKIIALSTYLGQHMFMSVVSLIMCLYNIKTKFKIG